MVFKWVGERDDEDEGEDEGSDYPFGVPAALNFMGRGPDQELSMIRFYGVPGFIMSCPNRPRLLGSH